MITPAEATAIAAACMAIGGIVGGTVSALINSRYRKGDLTDDQREYIKELRERNQQLQMHVDGLLKIRDEYMAEKSESKASIQVLGGKVEAQGIRIGALEAENGKLIDEIAGLRQNGYDLAVCQKELALVREMAERYNLECNVALRAQEKAEGALQQASHQIQQLQTEIAVTLTGKVVEAHGA